MTTRELRDVHMHFRMHDNPADLITDVQPNLPWAEDHFQERISGEPLNPPPSEAWWPYAQQGNAEHKQNQQFSHTYPERFWSKFANVGEIAPNGRQTFVPHMGIRYEYGDLMDLVKLLRAERYTRQAYLPIWFPEDTGNSLGVRVPCSLGYHFMFRDGKFHLTYFIRSCDFMRHFRDDVYMAIRLAIFVGIQSGILEEESNDLGDFTMVIPSLHIFEGDVPILQMQEKQALQAYNKKLMEALG